MPLDFPNSPTNGQIFTSGIKKWQWSTAEGSWLASNTTAEVPTGSVMAFPATSAPSGWIKLDGALLTRADYSALWTFAQSSGNIVSEAVWTATNTGSFSTGNLSTTFRIPDLRGEFVRGWDESRGIDSGRGIGVWQKGSLIAFDSTLGTVTTTSVTNEGSGVTPEASAKFEYGYDQIVPSLYHSGEAKYSGIAGTAGSITSEPNNFGATRPRNVSVLYCIKF
jgi:phage-related tail fiber protein